MSDRPTIVTPSRAVMAISEDRQWLVVLSPEPSDGHFWWAFYRWSSDDLVYEQHDIWNIGTGWRQVPEGQGAIAVLESFLQGVEPKEMLRDE